MKTFIFHYTNDTVIHGIFSTTAETVEAAEISFRNILGEEAQILNRGGRISQTLNSEQRIVYNYLRAFPGSKIGIISSNTGKPRPSVRRILFELHKMCLVIKVQCGMYHALEMEAST